MTDLDQSGYGFQRVRTYLGPSLGWVDEYVQPSVEIKTAGVYTVKPGNSILLVNVAAGVTIQLPDVRAWMQQNAYQPSTGFDRSITVKDFGGNAANFNIVVAPFGEQAIDNIQQTTVISTARAAVKFIPLINLSGWVVQSNVGASGGGGGGDVFKAGNNTFTGVNTFNDTITVPTELPEEDSNRAASTAWVKSQNYVLPVSLEPYALIASPTFTGTPKAPTPAPDADNATIVTVGFVENAIAAFTPGAPTTADYVIGTVTPSLPAGRIPTDTATIAWDLSTAGQLKANATTGGGNVSTSGSPATTNYARWVTGTTIEGRTPAQVRIDIGAQPAGNYQPLDGDLTALSGLTGTNTIYYRSAVDIWSPVAYSGLSFSGGVLTVTAGGGNISNSGTPVAGQIAEWTDATHVQGVSTYAKLASPVFTGDPQAPTPATSDNDQSIATTAFVQAAITAALGSGGFTTGDAKLTMKTVADPTWVMMNDGSIGNALSGATTRANADTQPLFVLLWNNVPEPWAPVSGGRGATAAADFAANKRIGLTRQLGRALCIGGAGAGLTNRQTGGFMGAETHTQTLAELFSHGHPISDPTHVHGPINAAYFMVGNNGVFVFAGGADLGMQMTNNLGANTAGAGTGISVTGAGSSSPMDIIQPSTFWNIMIKL